LLGWVLTVVGLLVFESEMYPTGVAGLLIPASHVRAVGGSMTSESPDDTAVGGTPSENYLTPQPRPDPRAEEGESRTPLWEFAEHEFTLWRKGEQAALENLVRRVTPTLWHLARAQHLDRATAEDVVQAAWLALVQAADSIREPRSVLNWLTVTTRREAWRASRDLGRREIATRDASRAARPVPGADVAVIADDEARNLWRQVAQLSERCRRLLRVVAFEERPDYPAVSAELRMPRGSIGPTRRRCLDKLRELLAAGDERRTET
jgi:RNA polymerase sigma factor (sigma-70 family)